MKVSDLEYIGLSQNHAVIIEASMSEYWREALRYGEIGGIANLHGGFMGPIGWCCNRLEGREQNLFLLGVLYGLKHAGHEVQDIFGDRKFDIRELVDG